MGLDFLYCFFYLQIQYISQIPGCRSVYRAFYVILCKISMGTLEVQFPLLFQLILFCTIFVHFNE